MARMSASTEIKAHDATNLKILTFKSNSFSSVTCAADVDDPPTIPRHQNLWHNQVGEKEMTNMVDRKLRLNPTLGLIYGTAMMPALLTSRSTGSV
jgi:hypothetical protein